MRVQSNPRVVWLCRCELCTSGLQTTHQQWTARKMSAHYHSGQVGAFLPYAETEFNIKMLNFNILWDWEWRRHARFSGHGSDGLGLD